MWNHDQSDVVRIYQTLEKNASDDEGVKLYRKFTGSKQEPVRLAAALRGFFLEDGVETEWREAFGAYLKRRIRPAAEALIEMDDVERLGRLEALGWLNAQLTDSFLQTAIRQRRTGMIVWLLQLKTRKYGYQDRDFQL